MIQFFHNGAEYTTRARLEAKYKLPHTTLQAMLEAMLEDKQFKRIQDGNKFYFLKVQVEQAIEAHIQQQLVAKAAKKNHPLPVSKFESLLRFAEHQASPTAR